MTLDDSYRTAIADSNKKMQFKCFISIVAINSECDVANCCIIDRDH